MSRVLIRAGVVQLLVQGAPRPYRLQLCPSCTASLVMPAEDGWTIDLIKVGPASGPVVALLIPHRPGCEVAEVTTLQGAAIRVPMSVATMTGPDPVLQVNVALAPHRAEPFRVAGVDGQQLVADWCGHSAGWPVLSESGFCGRPVDDPIHVTAGGAGA